MDGTKPLFSVVVPVYNAAKWIETCVRSVLCQNEGDLELILVDDGSTDGVEKIYDRVLEADGRVRVIRQANAGVSVARNCGLDAAQGSWVLFIDADDMLRPHALETMMETVEALGADMLFFRYDVFDGVKRRGESLTYGPLAGKAVSSACAIRALLEGNPKEMPWCYLARRDLYGSGDGSVRFPEGIAFMEDAATTWRVVSRAHTVAFIDDVMYDYRQTPSSKAASPSLRDAEDVAWVLRHSFYGGSELSWPGLNRTWWAHRATTAVIGYDRAWRSGETGSNRDCLCRELRLQALQAFRKAGVLACGPRLTLKVALISCRLWGLIAH